MKNDHSTKKDKARTVKPRKSSRLLIFSFYSFFDRNIKLKLYLALLAMLLGGISEFFSIGMILPFLASLSNPQSLNSIPFISGILVGLDPTENSRVISLFLLLVLVTSFSASLIKSLSLWLNEKLSADIGTDLGFTAFSNYLHLSYSKTLGYDFGTILSTVTTHVTRSTFAFTSLLQGISSLIIAIFIFVALFIIDAYAAVAAVTVIGCTYSLTAILLHRKILKNSEDIALAASIQANIVQQSINLRKFISLRNKHTYFSDLFFRQDRCQRQLNASNQFLIGFPRFILEFISILLIIILTTLLTRQNGSPELVLPVLGAFALGAQKLLPSLQIVYGSWNSLNAFNADLLKLLSFVELTKERTNTPTNSESATDKPEGPLILSNVSFEFPMAQKPVLHDINLSIDKGQRYAIVGKTGAGKSTLTDLIMGFLPPTAGSISIGGYDISDPSNRCHLNLWKSGISYVPQEISLIGGTFLQNIALGEDTFDIDVEKARNAAKLSHISAFIESHPQQYNTNISSNNCTLSSGQKQRIGLARALYTNPSLLVLDEFTSSLDAETERDLIDSIASLPRDITILMIAHRVATLQLCDYIIVLESGSIKDVVKQADYFKRYKLRSDMT